MRAAFRLTAAALLDGVRRRLMHPLSPSLAKLGQIGAGVLIVIAWMLIGAAFFTAVGAGIAWGIGSFSRMFLFAPVFGAVLGGYVGARLRLPKANSGHALSAKALVLRMLAFLTGVLVGGLAGGLISICVFIVLAVYFPLWQWLPPSMKESGPWMIPLSGGIIGAIFGGRCLYLWAVRRESGYVLGGFEQWLHRQHEAQVGDDQDRQ